MKGLWTNLARRSDVVEGLDHIVVAAVEGSGLVVVALVESCHSSLRRRLQRTEDGDAAEEEEVKLGGGGRGGGQVGRDFGTTDRRRR